MSSFSYPALKRAVDIFGSALGLIVLLPLFLIISIAIRIGSGHPAIYTQQRVGIGSRAFRFYKFRTMHADPDVSESPPWTVQSSDSRITRIGRYLRRTNLDELPQLWNVLKGDMSLVGPRPERPLFVDRFQLSIKGYSERHAVKPGMTGWAQVNGYVGNSSLEKRVEHDLYYIAHQSFMLDLRILLRTAVMAMRKLLQP